MNVTSYTWYKTTITSWICIIYVVYLVHDTQPRYRGEYDIMCMIRDHDIMMNMISYKWYTAMISWWIWYHVYDIVYMISWCPRCSLPRRFKIKQIKNTLFLTSKQIKQHRLTNCLHNTSAYGAMVNTKSYTWYTAISWWIWYHVHVTRPWYHGEHNIMYMISWCTRYCLPRRFKIK